MKKNFNYLIYIGLGVLSFSCSTQKKIQYQTKKNPNISQNQKSEQKNETKKSEILHIGNYDFFTENISEAGKNDNTISLGSIVSAKPKGYQVTKNHFPAVAQNFRQRFIILHYTNLNDEKSILVLTKRNVSSHYLVNDKDDAEIYQFVDENKRAYHAGVSHWRGFEQLNDTSIGIEITNMGFTNEAGQKVFADFPDWQVRKVATLVKDIAERYQIQPIHILGHSDIAPTRKQDPGPKFPWKRLYTEYGVGMWYDDATKEIFLNQISQEDFDTQSATSSFIYAYQKMLKDFGYGITPNGALDNATKLTIEAFQYHFRPEKCDGVMDKETYAILQSLLQKYPRK